MKTLKDLIKMKQTAMKAKYPNLPEHAIPTAKYQHNANGLTRAIIDFLKLSGHQAERISTTGRYLEEKNSQGHKTGRGQWIPGTSTKGSADISATIKGRSVKIEVKYGRDIQSDYQKRYQADIERAGGQYWLVHNLDEFMLIYNNFIQTL